MSKLNANSRVVASANQVSSQLSGEAVILDLGKGVYYGLDEVGARIWELIQVPRQVSEIRDLLLEEYAVEPARCEREVLDLLEELVAKGLVEGRDETAA